MRMWRLTAVLVTVASMAAASGSSATPSAGVRLVVSHHRLFPGENVSLRLESTSLLFYSSCPRLDRATAQGWREVTRSHGARVGCPLRLGSPQSPHTPAAVGLILYDDLRPGTYRITLWARLIPRHWKRLVPLSSRDLVLRQVIRLHPAPRLRRPRLSETRLLAIAEGAATSGGDPTPTIIQHAAGRRFEANLVASGDEVFEWNWSYLIAIRGRFSFPNAPRLAGGPAPGGSVITLVVDAATGEVTDSGVAKTFPDLAKLGPVTTDRG